MLVFLDIDGVMVPANSWRVPEILQDGFPAFTKKSVEALNEIIKTFDAKIVLTTTHKHTYSIEEWKDIFQKRNISVHSISRLPKNKDHSNRKDELLAWFHKSDITKDFIIIDDDKTLNDLPTFLKDKLIQTSASLGLTPNVVQESGILNGISSF